MNEQVERCALAKDLDISRVVTGLWQVADMERDAQMLDLNAMAAAMAPYVEAGLTTFDMADHYGSAEEITGLFLKQQSSGRTVELLTKWVPEPGSVTREDVRTAVQRSLDRMQTDKLDLLQFHTWTYADPSWLDCLFWLQELKGEGLVGNLGLTNFDTAHLRVVLQSGINVLSNQVCFSLLDQRPSREMTQLCRDHDVKLLAYGTVAGGFLTDNWVGRPDPGQGGTWSQMKYRRFIDEAGGWSVFQDLLNTLGDVARKHDVSIANVASRYILENDAVGGVIIGARLGKSEHIQETLNLFRFSLDAASRSTIEDALRTLRSIPGDSGDEYRKPPFLTASGDLSHHLESFPPPYRVEVKPGGRSVVVSGTMWEEIAGFCRAARQDNHIFISGTTATHRGQLVGGADPAAQLHFIIDKIEGALQSLGGRLEDVIRTRVFVQNISDWEAIARAHGARFSHILPTNTLVQAQLVGDEYLVEMEADAVLGRDNS